MIPAPVLASSFTNATLCSRLSHVDFFQLLRLALWPPATVSLVQSPLITKPFLSSCLLHPSCWAISPYSSSELRSLSREPFPASHHQTEADPSVLTDPSLSWEMHMPSCIHLSNIFVPDHLDGTFHTSTYMEGVAFVRHCSLSFQCNMEPNKFLGKLANLLLITIKF